MIWILIGVLLVASLVLVVIAVRGLQRDPRPVKELRRAILELETEIGRAFEPALWRLAEQLDRWRHDDVSVLDRRFIMLVTGRRFVGVRVGSRFVKFRDLRCNPKLFSERNGIKYRRLVRVGHWELGVRWDAARPQP